MKKNLISVIILALVFANFVLTALLIFTVLPETKKANQMIDAVCGAIKLDLNSGAGTGSTNIPVDQTEEYKVNAGEPLTINFAAGADGKKHYAVLGVTLLMNKESDGYKKYGADSAKGLSEKESIITNDINQVIRSYTLEEFDEDETAVQNQILSDLQGMFGADFIVGVNFTKVQTE